MNNDLLNKLLDIQDALAASRYAEARDLNYQLICETRKAMVDTSVSEVKNNIPLFQFDDSTVYENGFPDVHHV